MRIPDLGGGAGRIAAFVLINTLTSSAVVVEIKTPAARLVGPVYRGARSAEIHAPHAELSGAIAQLQAQMESAVTDLPLLAQTTRGWPSIDTSNIRGAVIMGQLGPLDETQRQSFMRYRAGLQRIEVLTFDEVHGRLRGLLDMLSDDSG